MKILIITTRIPYPPFRGDKLKIFNIAKNLTRNNDVKIITFYRFQKQLRDLEHLRKHKILVEGVRLTLFESVLKLFLSVFSNLPFQVAWFRSHKMYSKVFNEVIAGHYDVIYFHLIRSAQFFNSSFKSYGRIFVIDFTDAVSLYLKRFGETEKNIIKRFFIRVEQKRVEKYEKIADEFDSLFICSEIDKQFLQKRDIQADIKILNNGIDTKYFDGIDTDFEKNRIIFTGNMPYRANYDAVLYFVKSIFPLIRAKIPDAKFYIVGQNPPRKIKKLACHNIIVTGFVPDIKLEYLKSAVNVAPMRFGAGTLNKVLESISLGVPVVTTSIAVEGLPDELNKFVFIADSPDQFADRVVEIMKYRNFKNELLIEGKSVIRKLLSWENIVTEFELQLKNKLDGKN